MKCASFWVVAAIAAIAGAGAARAQPEGDATPPAEPVPAIERPVQRVPLFAPAAAAKVQRLSAQEREDWRFLKEAAAAMRFETDAARLALARTGDPRVRAFATSLVNHQASAGNELVRLLHMRGMAQPMLSNQQRMTLNRLGKLQGAKFDREFVEQVGLRHQQADVRFYEKAGAGGVDPMLKAWIDRTLPSLRDHLAAATRIATPDSRLAKARPAVNAMQPQTIRQDVARDAPGGANPFVSRASLSTRSMGAAPGPLGASPR